MGESEKQALQLSFNRYLRVGFQGSRVSSNGDWFWRGSWTSVWDSAN